MFKLGGIAGHEFETALGGLTMELGVESFLSRRIKMGPTGGIVLHLLAHESIEDSGDFSGGNSGGAGRTESGFEAAEVMTENGLTSME